jgi:hydrogenase nickel incorporation protein HypB
MNIDIKQDIMDTNNRYAAENREIFNIRKVFAVNVMGSPGAGKTTLLERTITYLKKHIMISVIEGDLATAKDAQRIASCGVSVVQINTGGGCHLDARMISQVLPGFYLEDTDMLIVENVGNLVCPAAFDLGEDMRMLVMSIAEGGDKPAKYPNAFLAAQVVVLNKLDLIDHVDIELEDIKRDILAINPRVKIFETCCRKGQIMGIDDLGDYLIKCVKGKSSR